MKYLQSIEFMKIVNRTNELYLHTKRVKTRQYKCKDCILYDYDTVGVNLHLMLYIIRVIFGGQHQLLIHWNHVNIVPIIALNFG